MGARARETSTMMWPLVVSKSTRKVAGAMTLGSGGFDFLQESAEIASTAHKAAERTFITSVFQSARRGAQHPDRGAGLRARARSGPERWATRTSRCQPGREPRRRA